MKYLRALLCFVFVVGLVLGPSSAVVAQQEHGGQEHGGGAVAPASDYDATILEAAAALEASNPDLAARLRALVEQAE